MEGFFKAIAVVFHPLFMPLFGACLVLNFVPFFDFAVMDGVKFNVYSILILIILGSALSLGSMRRNRIISDYQISDKSERRGPIFVVLLFFLFAYTLLRWRRAQYLLPDEIYGMFLGVVLSLGVAMLVSNFYKLSIHMIGISGVLGTIAALSINYDISSPPGKLTLISSLIFVCGLVGSSRMFTGHHTFNEIISGSLVGFLINYLVISEGLVIF